MRITFTPSSPQDHPSTAASRPSKVTPRFLLALLLGLAATTCTDNSTKIFGVEANGFPKHLSAVNQTVQIGRVDEFLDQPLAARVTNDAGDAVPGASIVWTFANGGGATSAGAQVSKELTSVTDSRGLSLIYWRLGTQAGDQQATASLSSSGTTTSEGRKVKFNSRATPGWVKKVVVAPDSLTLKPGESKALYPTVTDKWGNRISDVQLAWTSNSPDVAEVDSTGMATGVSPGYATITAAVGDISGSSATSVSGDAITSPGTVTDLNVSSLTDNSATLEWSQVDDGAGGPADYALRHSVSPLTWGAASATEVSVSGTLIGTKRQYTFTGLQPGTSYQFQLVAYRGTLGVDAVYGGMSNVASASTPSPAVADPGTVSDLKVTVLTDSSATMVWGQVDDGEGGPADYALRYGVSPLDWASASATEVSVSGTVVGDSLDYTFAGLQPGTSYQFQLVAYRGTPGVDAVYGGLSNVTSASTPTPAPSVATVSATPQAVTLSALGSTTQLQSVALDASGAQVTGVSWQWASLDAAVATVDASGLVTAKANGTTQVVVSAVGSTASDTVAITVSQVPAQLTVDPTSLSLSAGSTSQLTATVLDANNHPITGVSVTWASSNTSVATVSIQGLVTAIAEGSATITAATSGLSPTSADGPRAASSVTAGASVSVSATALDPGTVGDLRNVGVTDTSVTLRWTQVDDGTGNPAKYALRYGSPTLSWGSAYGTEVTVTGTGIGDTLDYTFTTLQAATDYQFQLVSYRGTLNVDAVFGGSSNVVSALTAASGGTQTGTISVTPASLSLTSINATAQLTAVAKDSMGATMSNPGFTWRSLASSIASVSSSGLVTAQAVGATAIVVSAACCGADTITVSVSQTPASVAVSPATVTSLALNATQQFTATVEDAGGSAIAGAAVTWSSTDPSVATVDASGLAKGISTGTTTIRAASGAATGDASLTVGATPPPEPVAEPVFRTGTDVMTKEDDFESYSNTTEMLNSGEWIFNQATSRGGSIVLDATGGAAATTRAVQLNFPDSPGSDLTMDIVNRRWDTTSRDMVFQVYFKMSSGFTFTGAGDDAKFFTIEKLGQGRKFADFNVFNNSVAIPNLWNNSHTGDVRWRPRFYPTDTSLTPSGAGTNAFYVQNLATTTKRPTDVADGRWHKMTLWRRAESVEDAGDGAIWLWIDGVLTISMDGSDASDPGYGQVYTRDYKVGGITIGANPMNMGSVQAQTLWFDQIRIWERN